MRSGRDLTQGSVFRHLLRLLIPMSLGIVASMTTGLVDAFWLGRLDPENPIELAAVSFAFPVTMAVFSVTIGVGAGSASVIARAAGAGDRERVRRLATHAFGLALLVALTVSVLGLVTIDPLFRAMGAGDQLMVHIHEYMRIWYVAVVFIVGPMIAMTSLRALGDAIAPSLLMVLVAVINLVLDPMLIFGFGPFPRLEVAGAALATAIANACAFLMAGWLVVRREKLITFERAGPGELAKSWRAIARIGVPAAGSNMINPVALAIVVAGFARFGPDVVAGFGAAARVEALAIIPLFALSASIGPLTGQNSGAQKTERVREAFQMSFTIALVWGVAVATLLALFRAPIAAAFTDNETAREALRLYLLILPVTAAGYGVIMSASAGFNGLGKPLPGMAMTFTRALALLAPGAWIGGQLGGVTGAFLGMGAANVISGLAVVGWVLLIAFPPPDRVFGDA